MKMDSLKSLSRGGKSWDVKWGRFIKGEAEILIDKGCALWGRGNWMKKGRRGRAGGREREREEEKAKQSKAGSWLAREQHCTHPQRRRKRWCESWSSLVCRCMGWKGKENFPSLYCVGCNLVNPVAGKGYMLVAERYESDDDDVLLRPDTGSFPVFLYSFWIFTAWSSNWLKEPSKGEFFWNDQQYTSRMKNIFSWPCNGKETEQSWYFNWSRPEE